MKRSRFFALLLVSALMLGLCACGSSAPAATPTAAPAATSAPAATAEAPQAASTEPAGEEGWVPTKDIEFVVPANAGGGSDIFARQMVKIIQDENLCPVNINVVNKPGGACVIGFTYLLDKKDDYTISSTSSSFYTQPISGNSPLGFDDFEYIAHMCKDPSLVAAYPGLGLTTLEEIVAYAKDHPGELKFGGSSALSDDAIVCKMICSIFDVDIPYVTFETGADVLSNTLGGHVALCTLSPAEAGEHIHTNSLVPIVVISDARLDILPDVPTAVESGADITHQQSRGVVMAAGRDEKVIAYYEELFRKVSESAAWKDFLAANTMMDAYMNSADYRLFVDDLVSDYNEFLSQLI